MSFHNFISMLNSYYLIYHLIKRLTFHKIICWCIFEKHTWFFLARSQNSGKVQKLQIWSKKVIPFFLPIKDDRFTLSLETAIKSWFEQRNTPTAYRILVLFVEKLTLQNVVLITWGPTYCDVRAGTAKRKGGKKSSKSAILHLCYCRAVGTGDG